MPVLAVEHQSSFLLLVNHVSALRVAILYNMQRLVSESNVFLDVNHFHITFTIDERLRRWFLVNRLALNDLFVRLYVGGLYNE